MKRILLLILCAMFFPVAHAQRVFTQPGVNIIGRGCTTAFYIDPLCKPCGVGMKASGQYPLLPAPTTGAAPTWSNGDLPDADPHDPSVCTTVQWQAKWISVVGAGLTWATATEAQQNQAMVDYLNQDFGFQNTANIYYLSQTGSDTTCETGSTANPNLPQHPCQSMAPIMTALAVKSTTFTGTVTVNGTNTITISGGCTGLLTFGTAITATDIPSSTYVFRQLSGTPGCDGTYAIANDNWVPVSATGSAGPETLSGSNYTGGVVVIEGGTWSSSTVPLYTNGCPTYGGNPCWSLSGSEGYPLLLMGYPGEVVNNETNGGMFGYQISNPPYYYGCCVTVAGMQLTSPLYNDLNGIVASHIRDWTIEYDEFSGFDDGVQIANPASNIVYKKNVCHDNGVHCVYYNLSVVGGNSIIGSYPSVSVTSGSNVLTLNTNSTAYNNRILGANILDGGVDLPGTVPVSSTPQGSANYLYIASLRSGSLGAVGSTYYMGGLNGGNAIGTNASDTLTGMTNTYILGGQSSTSFSFNFALDAQNVLANSSPGADYNDSVIDSIAYNEGNSGYEPYHFNTVMDGALIAGNIASYNGGAGAALQSGINNATIEGNIFFDNASSCANIFPNSSSIVIPETGESFVHNVCWAGDPAVSIRGSAPGPLLIMNNPTINGSAVWIKTVLVADNVMVCDCSSSAANSALQYEGANVFPETDTANDNVFWNDNAGLQSYVMIVPSTASSCASTYNGTFSFSGFVSYPCFNSTPSGNSFTASSPFSAASQSLLLTPGAFNFAPYNLR